MHWFDNHSGSIVLDQDEPGGFRTAYALQDVDILSPYAKGPVAGLFDLEVGANWVANGKVEGAEEGNYFKDDAWSEYVRIGKAFGPLQVNLQYVGSQKGGLISSGFDTYSSMINSSPESTNEPTSLYTMGNSLGRDDFDENLFIARLGYEVTPKLQLFGAVGSLNIDSPNAGSDTSMVYDLQARYQINKTLRTWVTLGMLEKNDAGRLSGNSVVGATPSGGLFEDDDVIAGSPNIGASF
ncbi:hypothetical protein [Stutzerimonas stutzeri]|uniref:hypothetical protein n=1 Tax=Stutzerimonas stutzeri TaxID=316 RepID=UPI00210B8E29|nr:hypothetical protein [Stutzerimonas stutzeri]MCQ4320124.1 hypothetical protein [Stutzerimonas stutzeri]